MTASWLTPLKTNRLWERCQRRASQVQSGDRNLALKLYDAMIHAENEADTLGLFYGTILAEEKPALTIDRAVEYLKTVTPFDGVDDQDLRDLVSYFVEQDATAVVFAPEVLSSFMDFSKHVGFPCTLGGAERAGLEAPRYDTRTLLRALVGAHVLTVFEVPAVDALDANHNGSEDLEFRKNPKQKVDVYEYDLGFVREVGHVLRQLGAKSESLVGRTFLQRMEEKTMIEGSSSVEFRRLETKLRELTQLVEWEENE